jgi:hypothetical protein
VYPLQPMLSSILTAVHGDSQSAGARLTVSPELQLRRTGAGVFAVDVSAGNGATFVRPAALQRYDTHTKKWRTIATAKLKPPTDPGALIAVSSGAFHAKVARGTLLRAYLSQVAAGDCYQAAASASLKT